MLLENEIATCGGKQKRYPAVRIISLETCCHQTSWNVGMGEINIGKCKCL